MQKIKNPMYTINEVVATLYHLNGQKGLAASDVKFDKKYRVELATGCNGYFSGLPVYRNNPSGIMPKSASLYRFDINGVRLSIHNPLREKLAGEVISALKTFSGDDWYTYYDEVQEQDIPKMVDLDAFLQDRLAAVFPYEDISVLFVNKHRAVVKNLDAIQTDSWTQIR